MLAVLRMNSDDFDAYINEMQTYRDKFVAHLDLENVMYPPRLRLARRSASYLYDYVLLHEDDDGFFPEGPLTAARFYRLFANEGRGVYAV